MHEAELAFARLGLYRDEGGIPAFRIPRADLPRWAALVGEFGYMLEGSPTECCKTISIDATELMGIVYTSFHVDMRMVRAVSWTLIALLALLPNIVRTRCEWLWSLTSDGDTTEHDDRICQSTAFFGTGAIVNVFSVLEILLAVAYAVPLTLFFTTLVVANLRLFSCAQKYGHLIRSDVRAMRGFATLDLTVGAGAFIGVLVSSGGCTALKIKRSGKLKFFAMCLVLRLYIGSWEYFSMDSQSPRSP